MLAGLKNLLEALHLTKQNGVADQRHDVTVELHASEHALLENHERRLLLIEQNMGIQSVSNLSPGGMASSATDSSDGSGVAGVSASAAAQSQAETKPEGQ